MHTLRTYEDERNGTRTDEEAGDHVIVGSQHSTHVKYFIHNNVIFSLKNHF